MKNKKRLAIEDFRSENKLQIVKELAFNMQNESKEKKSFIKEAKEIVGKAKIKVLYTEIELTWDAEMTIKELNLCELLKDCVGMKFYTPHFGDLFLSKIDIANHAIILTDYTIKVPIHESGVSQIGMNASEICVFPSKEQRDWSSFQPPWIPQKGERVWVRHKGMPEAWYAAYFAEYMPNADMKYWTYCDQKKSGATTNWHECAPFNEIPW